MVANTCTFLFSILTNRLFYRFHLVREDRMGDTGRTLSDETLDEQEHGDDWREFTRRGRGSSQMTPLTSSMNSSLNNSSMNNSWSMSNNGTLRSSRNLTKVAQKFVDIVNVRDRKHHMRVYRRVFVGAEAVVRQLETNLRKMLYLWTPCLTPCDIA